MDNNNCSLMWEIAGPGVSGAVFGAGWWFWVDAVVCSSVKVSSLHYLPDRFKNKPWVRDPKLSAVEGITQEFEPHVVLSDQDDDLANSEEADDEQVNIQVNASGHFCGVAEMIGPVDFHKDLDFWLQDKWTGSFPVKWHIVKDIPNSSFWHIILVNNEYRPVTSSRDTQEVLYLPGINMLTIFKNTPLKTSLLDAFMFYENCQRKMQEEKSILALKRYDSSGSLPAVSTSDKPVRAVNQPAIASGLEADVNARNLESNERTPVDHTGNEDEKAESQSNDTVNQPAKINADIANDASLPQKN